MSNISEMRKPKASMLLLRRSVAICNRPRKVSRDGRAMISLPVARAVPSDEQRGPRPERVQLQKVVPVREKRYFQPFPGGGKAQARILQKYSVKTKTSSLWSLPLAAPQCGLQLGGFALPRTVGLEARGRPGHTKKKDPNLPPLERACCSAGGARRLRRDEA